MDHPRKFEHQNTSFQSLRTDTSLEKAKEVKPPMINVVGGGDGGDQIWPKSDLGRAAEGSSFGSLGAGATGTKNEDQNKGRGDQEQPALQAASRSQHFEDDTDLNMICKAFSRLQLQELDRVFQRTQYPAVFVQKELGTPASAESNAESVERGELEEEVSNEAF